MNRTEPLPLEPRILELLRAQWARAHATHALLDGVVVEAKITVTQQNVRVEVLTRTSRTVDNTDELR